MYRHNRMVVLRAQIGLNFDDVRMAVLCQRVVPAHYAFVIHTRNPSNNDEKEVFCEMVRGLGGWCAVRVCAHASAA